MKTKEKNKITLRRARILIYPWLGLLLLIAFIGIAINKLFSLGVIIPLFFIWRGLETCNYGDDIERGSVEVKDKK